MEFRGTPLIPDPGILAGERGGGKGARPPLLACIPVNRVKCREKFREVLGARRAPVSSLALALIGRDQADAICGFN